MQRSESKDAGKHQRRKPETQVKGQETKQA